MCFEQPTANKFSDAARMNSDMRIFIIVNDAYSVISWKSVHAIVHG